MRSTVEILPGSGKDASGIEGIEFRLLKGNFHVGSYQVGILAEGF